MTKPQKKYRITIETPGDLYPAELHTLFSAVASTAHKWENKQSNRNWGINVSGRIITE